MKGILLALVVAFALSACGKSEVKPVSAEYERRWDEYLAASTKEANTLIAVKYGVSQNVADDIINTYRKRHDIVSQFMNATSGKAPSSSYAATLSELSGKHSIPLDKVASIIFDLKIWTAVEAHQ